MDWLFGRRIWLTGCLGGESSGLVVWEENPLNWLFGKRIVWTGCLGGESGRLVVCEQN